MGQTVEVAATSGSLTEERLAEVEAKCREAIAAREAEGVAILPLANHGKKPSGSECVLEAVSRRNDFSYDTRAAEVLGLSLQGVTGIEGGFEGWQSQLIENPRLFAIGLKLRNEQLAKHAVLL